jgi:hypothetical protein
MGFLVYEVDWAAFLSVLHIPLPVLFTATDNLSLNITAV